MRRLHIEKAGLRGLAIAESHAPGSSHSVLAGVVMRRDLVIDGFVLGRATVFGDDSTDAILEMCSRLRRPDVSYVLLSGLIISMYNIIEMERIRRSLEVPVVGVTYRDSKGLSSALVGRFDPKKICRYRRLGRRERIRLGDAEVFVRCAGCTAAEARQLLADLTLQGSVPEPLRVARLLARVVSS